MKKNRIPATDNPGWKCEIKRQKGMALLPGLSYYLWRANCSCLLQDRNSLPVFMYSKVQRNISVCVCAQNGRTSKQELH